MTQAHYMIREATLDDIEELVDVQIKAWRETYEGIINADFLSRMTPTPARALCWRYQYFHTVTFVAIDKEDSSIVGFATVGKRRSLADCAPDIQVALRDIDGELYAIYLLKKAQRKGLATYLFMLASRIAKLRFDFTKLCCWVLTANHPAKSFYQTIGGEYSNISKMYIIEEKHHYPEQCYVWDL